MLTSIMEKNIVHNLHLLRKYRVILKSATNITITSFLTITRFFHIKCPTDIFSFKIQPGR